MNEQKKDLNNLIKEQKSDTMQKEETPICQFYIVLGRHDRTFQNDEKNRYFPLSGNEDINLIQYALGEEWKKKKKEHIKVASEIIFLIPDLSYKDLVKELMDKLNCRGKFQVLRPLKKEPVIQEEVKKEPKPNIVEEKEEQTKEPEKTSTSPLMSMKAQIEKEGNNEIKKEEKKINLPKEDNIFHGDFPKKPSNITNIKKEDEKDIKDYMWGDAKNSKLTKKKKEKKIDLPIIIFVVSALFLIGAVILLWILK